MVSDLAPKDIWGVWVRKNKTFYYLESGETTLVNPQDKIINILFGKGIIKIDTQNKVKAFEEPYIVMPMDKAQERNYTIEILFANSHIKSIYETRLKTEKKAKTSPWE